VKAENRARMVAQLEASRVGEEQLAMLRRIGAASKRETRREKARRALAMERAGLAVGAGMGLYREGSARKGAGGAPPGEPEEAEVSDESDESEGDAPSGGAGPAGAPDAAGASGEADDDEPVDVEAIAGEAGLGDAAVALARALRARLRPGEEDDGRRGAGDGRRCRGAWTTTCGGTGTCRSSGPRAWRRRGRACRSWRWSRR